MIPSREFIEEVLKLDGSNLIATRRFLDRLRPRILDQHSLIDYGAGIGTISLYALSLNKGLTIVPIEPDSWCRRRYEENLVSWGFNPSPSVDSLSAASVPKGALWVVDIAFESGDIRSMLESNPSEIWVEGHRYDQRVKIASQALAQGRYFKYSSFLGFPKSEKGGAVFEAVEKTNFTMLLQWIAILRIRMVMNLRLHIIEWEVNRRIFGLKK